MSPVEVHDHRSLKGPDVVTATMTPKGSSKEQSEIEMSGLSQTNINIINNLEKICEGALEEPAPP